MNFADLNFWVLLVSTVAFALVLGHFLRLSPPLRSIYDKWCLVIAGLVLLASTDPLTVVIYIYVITVSYWGLLYLVRRRIPTRAGFFAVVLLQIWPLLAFKYLRFLLQDVLRMPPPGFLTDLVIPVGISFYTFQAIAFAADTLAFKKPVPAFIDWLNFIGFFPQLVAGPIERGQDLLPQVQTFVLRPRWQGFQEGVPWLAVGFFFKACLADNLAPLIIQQPALSGWQVWLNNVLFGLRIYYDFAGYSLIAFGIARVWGIRLTLNFCSPYCSTSCSEFWRRWHITLSNWFRDYVYFPLGGSRDNSVSQLRWIRNVFAVFLLSGIWHGAGWNFVLWGAVHGALLVLTRKRWLPWLSSPVRWMGTMLVVMFSWLFFYRTNMGVLSADLRSLISPAAYSPAALKETLARYGESDLVLLGALLLLCAATLTLEWRSLRRGDPYVLLRGPVATIVLLVITFLMAPTVDNGFIYFAF